MNRTVGLAINGANSSGKSRLLRQLRSDARFSHVVVFEMDSQRYWLPERQSTEAEVVNWFAGAWRDPDVQDAAWEALQDNVRLADPKRRTVKLAFCRLCASGRPFLTVRPQVLRGTDEAEFFALLTRVWGTEIVQVAVIPSPFAHIRNVLRRRDRRWRSILRGRRCIRRSRDSYAVLVRNRLFRGMKADAETLLRFVT